MAPVNFCWAISVLWNKGMTFPLHFSLLFTCFIPRKRGRNAQTPMASSLLCSGTQVLEMLELMKGQRRDVCTSSLFSIGRYRYETPLFHVNAQPRLTCTANVDPNNGILALQGNMPCHFSDMLPACTLG